MATDGTQEKTSRSDTRVDGLTVRSWIAVAVAIGVVVLGFGAWWTYGLGRDGMTTPGGMGGMSTSEDVPRFPPVTGYYDGERVFFVHTEVSDGETGELLTGMMDSPVVTVPDLAGVPEAALGRVFVFTDGVRPDGPRGPLGFQPDVFDSAPGDSGYTPLRRLVQLTWSDDAEPRVLTSATEVQQAIEAEELSMKATDVVVNAPLLTWPDGER
jgi:hypothetical protein